MEISSTAMRELKKCIFFEIMIDLSGGKALEIAK